MQKLLLDALAHNLTVRNNQYLVGIADRIQPVSYDNQRFSRHQFADGLLDQCLVLRVGSSKMMTDAFLSMARAMVMRCRSPPESRSPASPAMVS